MTSPDAPHPGAGGDEPVEVPIDGELDLHAFRPRDVPELVGDYLDECRRRGVLQVRIVHGKGIGALRETVHRVLERRDDVERFRLDSETGAGWGATLVELKARG
jgi:DNA-nicking Smr family endonuclease